jgi:hypothetical protein
VAKLGIANYFCACQTTARHSRVAFRARPINQSQVETELEVKVVSTVHVA